MRKSFESAEKSQSPTGIKVIRTHKLSPKDSIGKNTDDDKVLRTENNSILKKSIGTPEP